MKKWPRSVPALVAVAVLATGCTGSGDNQGAANSSSPSAAPTLDLPAVPTARPAQGPEQSGAGYTYNLPRGWADITEQMKAKDAKLATAARPEVLTPPFTPSMNTYSTKNTFTGALSEEDLASLGEQIKTQLAPTVPDATVADPLMLDGTPVLRAEGVASEKNPRFHLIQYTAIHGNTNVAISFSFPTSTPKAERDRIVRVVLASWTWQ